MLTRAAQIWVPRVSRAELPLLLFASPAFLFPTVQLVPVIGVVLAALAITARISTGRIVPATPLNVPLAVLLATVAVSVLASADALRGLDKVAGVIFGSAMFWALARSLSTPRRVERAMDAFAAAGAGLAFVGLIATDWQLKWPIIGPFAASLPTIVTGVRGAETGANPNALAGALVLFIPAQAAMAWWTWLERGRSARLAARVVALAASCTALTLAQSRGALLGLATTALCLWLFKGGRRRAVPAALATAVILTVVMIAVGPSRLAGLLVEVDAGSRVELWERALDGIRDFPLTGMGMGGFRSSVPGLYAVYRTPSDMPVPHAHNQILQVALDVGLPGLIAYLALWIAAFALLGSTAVRTDSSRARAMSAGIAGGLIAHAVFGLNDAISLGTKVGLFFWILLALAVAVHAACARDGAAATRDA